MFLHFRDGTFKAFFFVERSLLILPLLNIGIIKPHERKFVDFKHYIADGKKLLNLLNQIDVSLQQLICSRCKPTFWSFAVCVLCFFVFDTDAKYIFLATRKVALDDADFFCTFANTAILSSGLLNALFRNSAICFSSPLTAVTSAICASCAAGSFAVLHQLRNLFIAAFQMCRKDCRSICFNDGNANIGSAGVNA